MDGWDGRMGAVRGSRRLFAFRDTGAMCRWTLSDPFR